MVCLKKMFKIIIIMLILKIQIQKIIINNNFKMANKIINNKFKIIINNKLQINNKVFKIIINNNLLYHLIQTKIKQYLYTPLKTKS